MQGQHSRQSSFLGMIYDEWVPADQLLRRIAVAVDFTFVCELVGDCYCADNGRPSWDPLVLFKVVFLQFLYDLSDGQVEEQVNLPLACKWLVGLQPEESGPDHSTLCRFRSRRQGCGAPLPPQPRGSQGRTGITSERKEEAYHGQVGHSRVVCKCRDGGASMGRGLVCGVRGQVQRSSC